ncbi:MAG: riboflavin synthase [Desulfobacterales bacterium]|nr:riboflavin synthase [Desulfobacterales bacterium]
MFTGIVQGKGRVVEKRPAGKGMVFTLAADFELPDPRPGESIAVNGVCLTAKEITGPRFSVDVSPESLARTTLGRLAVGGVVNLERALRLSDRLGGHLVSGHVDGVAPVIELRPEGDFVRFTFGIPAGFARYIIEKGSIAVDGISLTVNCCDRESFSVAIIPHTLEVTTLGILGKGDRVNIEVDLIGKYVEKLLAVKSESDRPAEPRINPAFLAEHGFIR